MNAKTSSWMTPERRTLHKVAYDFATARVAKGLERWRLQQHIDREFWHEAGELGLLCCGVPAEYGGGGGTVVDDFVVLDAFVRAGISPAAQQVHSIVVPHYIVEYGTPAQRERWLPGMCSGELIGAIAMTEPDAGSDLQSMRSRAVRQGDDYVLCGTKIFITGWLSGHFSASLAGAVGARAGAAWADVFGPVMSCFGPVMSCFGSVMSCSSDAKAARPRPGTDIREPSSAGYRGRRGARAPPRPRRRSGGRSATARSPPRLRR